MTEVLKGRRSSLFDRYVRGELHLGRGEVEGIVSESEGIKEVLLELSVVAPFTDVPILLLGEPGVGKSHLADIVHRKSGQRGEHCTTVDCGMLRDERSFGDLWGWKKGAFTGAIADHPGRISTAAGGTLFLDEFSRSTQPPQELPPIGDGFCLDDVLNDIRLRYLKQAWAKASGNKSKVAKLLGFKSRTPLKTLTDNLAHAGYPVNDFR